MKLGFTGSRTQPTGAQLRRLALLFTELSVSELHHGCCVGSDTAAHLVAQREGIRVVGHPPVDQRLAVVNELDFDELREPEEYLTRNHAIVAETERLVALPDGPERLRSGTWATVRAAVRSGKPVVVIYPSGQTEQR